MDEKNPKYFLDYKLVIDSIDSNFSGNSSILYTINIIL